MYPTEVLRKVNSDIRKDHLTFITDDKKHDLRFVELCNERLHASYKEERINITHDVEYKECDSQFKYLLAFSSSARHSIKTTHMFCKTSHAISKLDGLGGVIETFASRGVRRKNNHS